MIRTIRLLAKFAVLSTALVIMACGGGGGGGAAPAPITSPTDTTTPVPTYTSYPGDEGTPQSPVSVSIGTFRPSTVGIGDSFYTFIPSVTGSYSIALTNPTVDVGWELFTDTGYSSSTMVSWCDNAWTAVTEKCAVNLVAGIPYYLRVYNWGWEAATFDLNIKLLSNEGSSPSPIDLVVDVPREGSVDKSGTSYYRFTTNGASAYSVAISNLSSGPITTKIYANAFGTNPLQTCSTWDRPVCTVNGLSASTAYYVEVIGTNTAGVGYTVTVTKGVSQGSIANPVVLTVDAVNAHAGAVDGTSDSYYTFTTASSGEYLLKLDALYGVAATVYTNPDFTNGYVSSCAVSECRLTALNAYAPYYIRVRNTTTSDQAFTIAVNRGLTEGSVAQPIPLTVGVLHSAIVNSSGVAYYSFQTTSFSGSYTISLTSTQTDLKWNLYTSLSAYNSISQCNTSTSAVNESCVSTNLNPNTTYYLTVTNNSSTTASDYNVLVTAGGGSQGTTSSPVDLGVVTPGGLTYNSGQVKNNGDSYYKFTTSSNKAVHVISLLGMQTDLEWGLSTGPVTVAFTTCDLYNDTRTETCSTQDATYDSVLVANTTYYLRVRNNGNTTSTFSLILTALDPAAGCTGTYTECLNFENGIIPAQFIQTTNQNGSQWKWTLDSTNSAGVGNYSMISGTIDYSLKGCFSYTPTVRPTLVTFSFMTQEGYVDFDVFEGTNLVFATYDGTLGFWQRNTYALPSGAAPLTFTWCQHNYSTTSTPVSWVDDIMFQ